jgi:hypothetical protein
MRIKDSFGLTVFLLAGVAPAPGQSVPRLEKVRQIGCATCSGPAQFAEIADLAVGRSGSIHVLDSSAPYLRVFDTRGQSTLTAGSAGQGPAEFRTPFDLALQGDSALHIADIRNSRITVLDSRGREKRTKRMAAVAVAMARSAAGITWLAVTDFVTPTLQIQRWRDGADTPETVIRFGPEFPQRAEGQPSMYVALAANPQGGFAVGDGTSEYRIAIYDSTGKQVQEIRREISRPRRSPAEIAQERERRQRAAARTEAMRNAESRGRGARSTDADIPVLKAHFLATALRYDDAGRLWVRTERGGADNTIFDLFDGSGEWLGEVRLPDRIGRFALGAGLLAGVTFDADEAQYVAVYRLVDPIIPATPG